MIEHRAGNNPLTVLACFRKGFQLLGHQQLRKFVTIPILVNVVLYGMAFWVGYVTVNQVLRQFMPAWLSWLNWLIGPLLIVTFFMAMFFTFTLLVNLLCAPFYGKLAEQTLALISDEALVVQELPLSQVLWGEVVRLVYIVSRTLPLLVLSVIPALNLLAPFCWGLLGAWGMALEFMAYPLENDGLGFKAQRQQLARIRLGALSFGGITTLGLAVPLLNMLIPPVAVMSATIYWHTLRQAGQQADAHGV